MNAPAIATGAPKPAAPSMNAPKQNATSSTCRRRSGVIPAIDSFMISNCPVSTEMSYRYTAARTIHAIFRTPYATPYPKADAARISGMWNIRIPTSTAVPAPATAHQCGFTRKPASNENSTMIGNAATSVESHQWPSGSYTWVQCITNSFTQRCPDRGHSAASYILANSNCQDERACVAESLEGTLPLGSAENSFFCHAAATRRKTESCGVARPDGV